MAKEVKDMDNPSKVFLAIILILFVTLSIVVYSFFEKREPTKNTFEAVMEKLEENYDIHINHDMQPTQNA